MNSPSNAMPESLDSQRVAPAVLSETRPLYWSVRRELWENRWVSLGPLVAGGIFLFGYLISLFGLPHRMSEISALNPAQQHSAILAPYDMAAGLLMLTQILVGVFYCLDAFQGERRDRSILFWKSLPVSDLTTVLAKASIPFVILPLVTVAVTVFAQLVILLLSTFVLLASGHSVAFLWAHVPWLQISWAVFYHIVTVHTLLYAPFYGWLLLVSAWARRAAYLWAFFPVLAITFLEKIIFSTSYVANMLLSRLTGGMESVAPADRMPIDPMTHFTPLKFLGSAELWIGLGLTAAFLAVAVRLRRYRDPI